MVYLHRANYDGFLFSVIRVLTGKRTVSPRLHGPSPGQARGKFQGYKLGLPGSYRRLTWESAMAKWKGHKQSPMPVLVPVLVSVLAHKTRMLRSVA